jgi:chromosomal replication initiator protein
MYLCRNLLNMTLPQIGQEFGNRDHTTVMHSCSKVADDINGEGTLIKDLDEIKKRIAS